MSMSLPSKRQLFADCLRVTVAAPMFFTMSVAPPPKKILAVHPVIVAVMGCVVALNRIASLFPPESTVLTSVYLRVELVMTSSGVSVVPLLSMMSGERVAAV